MFINHFLNRDRAGHRRFFAKRSRQSTKGITREMPSGMQRRSRHDYV